MGSKISELRKQSLEDFNYIHSKYGVGQSHDSDDDRLMDLLKNPSNETALRILKDYIREYFDIGYVGHFDDLFQLPEDDEILNKIKERWDI